MNPWLRVFLPFAAGYYLSYLLRTVNAVIAPELTRELSLSAADLGLLTSTYLLAFGAFQIPLGILLDRYGARRVEAALLLFTALGAALFAYGHTLAELAVARGLIGLGVSACLMAGFKSFTQSFPSDRQASLTGAIMASGGLGALTASLPLEAALPLIGWRGAFIALTLLAGLVAAAIFFVVPEHRAEAAHHTLAEQWRGVAEVFRSRVFWRFAPQAGLFAGGFMALQGLWAVPWLMTVSGASRSLAAEHLFAMGIAMLACNLGIAALATRLSRAGIRPVMLLSGGTALALVCELAIILGAAFTLPLWAAFGLFVSTSSLGYSVLAAHFPPALSGRVTTALNLLAFVGAFGLQWGIGVLVDALGAVGLDPVASYRIAFGAMFAMQAMAYAWFVLEGRRK
ncbi:MAG: MFS transporter [Rhodocyclales bacterium]|nr:MFS transporter [Rhodocyclales bacterium]